MSPRKNDLESLAALANFENHRPDSLSGTVDLAGNLLASGEDRFDFADIDGNDASFISLNDTDNKRSPLCDVFVEEGVSLRLSDFLDHDLFCCLGGDSAERDGINVFAGGRRGDFTRFTIHMHLQIGFLTEMLSSGGQVRRFNAIENDLSLDVLVAVDGIDDPQEFAVHSFLPTRTHQKEAIEEPAFCRPTIDGSIVPDHRSSASRF
jgi:hypothetical protein